MVVLIWRFLCLRRVCREYPERLMNFLTSVRRLILSDKRLTLVAVILSMFFIYRLESYRRIFVLYLSLNPYIMWLVIVFLCIFLASAYREKNKERRLVLSIIWAIAILLTIGFQIGRDRAKADITTEESVISKTK